MNKRESYVAGWDAATDAVLEYLRQNRLTLSDEQSETILAVVQNGAPIGVHAERVRLGAEDAIEDIRMRLAAVIERQARAALDRAIDEVLKVRSPQPAYPSSDDVPRYVVREDTAQP